MMRPLPRFLPQLLIDRPWYDPRTIVRRVICYYLVVCLMLFFLQNSLLFPRWLTGAVFSKAQAEAQAAQLGLVPWADGSPAKKLRGYVRFDFFTRPGRGTVVVFHGNAGTAFDRLYYVDAFARRGLRCLLYEYPGYGGRPGSPSAGSIIGDAQSLTRSLDQAGYGPIYLWGESVGAGIAAEVCSAPNLPVRGLVLLTPWDSLTHAASYHYPIIPISLLLWDRYDSIKNLARFRAPVCVICSTGDQILPLKLGLNLFEHLPEPKKLILQQGYGHNDWPSSPELAWWDEALKFITPPIR